VLDTGLAICSVESAIDGDPGSLPVEAEGAALVLVENGCDTCSLGRPPLLERFSDLW